MGAFQEGYEVTRNCADAAALDPRQLLIVWRQNKGPALSEPSLLL